MDLFRLSYAYERVIVMWCVNDLIRLSMDVCFNSCDMLMVYSKFQLLILVLLFKLLNCSRGNT